MRKLDYFKGKPCTILTSPVNKHFIDENQYTNTFFGIIEDFDECGVWLLHVGSHKKSFFTYGSLVGILEEVVTPFKDDEEARHFRKEVENKVMKPQEDQKLITVDSLKRLRDKAKE